MKQIITILFILCCVQFSFSENDGQNYTQTIRGTVVDKYNKLPLIGANIILLGTEPLIGTTTDVDGKFRLENIAIGRISIAVKFMGYNDVYLNNLELTSGKELVLTIEMEEMVIQGQEVVIVAKVDKTQSQNKMATVSARSFSVEESMRYAGSMNDVARMASNFAGVFSSNDSRNDIVIRGNSPTGLLWRLEGIDIPSPNHYSTFGSTGGPVGMLNNNVLDNSDFITAAFPADYGNALSGVFDLKMRNGNNEKHEFLGQIGFNGFELGAEGPINKANGSSYLINARYSTLEFMSKMGMDFGTGAAIPKYKDMTFKINMPNTAIGRVSFFGVGGISDIEFNNSEKKPEDIDENEDLYSDELYDLVNGADMATLGANHTLLFNNNSYGKLSLAYTYQYSHTSIDSFPKIGAATHPFVRQNFTEEKYFASYFVSKKLNSKHEVKLGGIFNHREFSLHDSVFMNNYNRFITNRNSSGHVESMQPYMQWRYKISDQLVMNTGLHYLYFLYNDTYSIEPRWGLRWIFKPNQSINFGYGRHSQIAPITTYFSQVLLADSIHYIIPNKNLEMTHAHHFVIGYDLNINEFTRIKSEVYYQIIRNVPVDKSENNAYSMLNEGANFYVYTPDYLKNEGTGYNYGAELTLERFLHKGLYFLTTLSLFESKYEGSDKIEHNTAFNGNYVANLLLGKEFEMNRDKKHPFSINIDVKTNYAGGRRYTPAYSLFNSTTGQYYLEYDEADAFSKKYPDYSRTDLRLGIKRNGKKITQEWALDVQNVFNHKNPFMQIVDQKSGNVKYSYQTGFMIIPQYKIMF